MSRRFQFSLRALLVAMFSIAVIVIPFGYFIRLPPPPIEIEASGTVTLDGAPLSDAMIGFLDADGRGRWTSTDTAGKFVLPALPGSYAVAVTKIVAVGPARDAKSGELIDPTKNRIGAVKVETRSVIPERYGDRNSSGLKAEVREGAVNRFVYQLVTP